MTRYLEGPDVSIVTICFRNPAEVAVTLKSIAPLAALGMESIVVDGSPDDSCADVVAEYSFVRHLHGPDLGKYDAMNKGVAAARGRAVIFMNSGDHFYDPAAFATMVAHHRQALATSLVYGDCIKVVDGERIFVVAPDIAPDTLRVGILPSHQSILAPAEWLRSHPFDVALDFAADTKVLKRAFRDLPLVYVEQPIAVFAFGGISASPGSYARLVQQHRELVAVHELSRIEAVRLALFLARRKLAHSVIGETGLQKIQAARLKARLRQSMERG